VLSKELGEESSCLLTADVGLEDAVATASEHSFLAADVGLEDPVATASDEGACFAADCGLERLPVGE
jgi:hypothetical protein